MRVYEYGITSRNRNKVSIVVQPGSALAIVLSDC